MGRPKQKVKQNHDEYTFLYPVIKQDLVVNIIAQRTTQEDL